MAEKLNQVEPLEHNKPMPVWYLDAFVMRFMGLSYPQIAQKTGKSLSSIKQLFYKGGSMYRYWRDYVDSGKSEVVEESMDMLYGRLPDSVRKLIMHAQEGRGLVSLEAIKTQMAYTIGKPEDRIKLDATVGIFNFTDWALAQSEEIKAYEAARRTGEDIDQVQGKA